MPNSNDRAGIRELTARSKTGSQPTDILPEEHDWRETLFDVQIQVLEKVARGAPLGDIMDFALRLCEGHSDEMLCSILLLDSEGLHLRHGGAPSLPVAYMRAIDGVPIGPSVGSCGTAAFLGEPVIVEDIETDPYWAEYRHLASPHGLRACWSTPIFDTSRKVLGTFAIYYRSPGRPTERHIQLIAIITHLTSIAIMRHRTEAALRRSESRYRRLAESNTIGVVIADIHGKVKEANDFFLDLFGRTREELRAGLVDWTDMTPPDWKLVDRQVLGELAVAGVSTPFEKELLHKDGYRVPIRAIVTMMEGSKEEGIGLVEDMTERKRAEERLRQSEKMTAIGQLAGGVAHDFNNQLSIILGYAELLNSRLKGSDLIRFAEPIVVAAKRSGELTKNLLSFSRQGHFERVLIDFHELIDEIFDLLGHTIDKRIVLTRSIRADQAFVLGDPTRLQNAVLNLALNARDAILDGGAITIATELVEAGQSGQGIAGKAPTAAGETLPVLTSGTYLRVSVRDTGTGMSEEIKNRIFEPFFTTKPVGKGTGLGLAAVFGTVKIHEGWISVETRLGEGSAFHIYLPLADRKAVAKQAPGELLPKGIRILVVEDELQVREMLETMLKVDGHTVIKADGGNQALAIYRTRWSEIDLVILDMVMADMSGDDTFFAINPDVKVLISSGYGAEGNVQSLLKSGALGLLQKPYLKGQLDMMIAKALAFK